MKQLDLHRHVFIVLLVLSTLAFLWILKPFYGAILWGIVLATMFYPMNEYFLRKLPGRKNLAAVITMSIAMVVVVLPLIGVVIAIAHESTEIYQAVLTDSMSLDSSLESLIGYLPDSLRELLTKFGLLTPGSFEQKVSSGILRASQYLAEQLFVIGQGMLDFLISFFLMSYLLFFLLRDGKEIATTIRRRIPMTDSHKLLLLAKFVGVIRATIKGNVVVALVQGIVGGVTFWLLGIPAPILWGTAIAVFALLPAGSGVIWTPVSLFYFMKGNIMAGVVLLVVGVFIIAISDTWLRPVLVGHDAQMPDYIVFVSTFGGMALFGLNGFVIGPMIAAIFITFWELQNALSHRPAPKSHVFPGYHEPDDEDS